MPLPAGVYTRKKPPKSGHFRPERRYFGRHARGASPRDSGLPILALGAIALVTLVVVSNR